jgi:hypothetical protein
VASALTVSVLMDRIAQLEEVVREAWPFLFADDGTPIAPEELREKVKALHLSETCHPKPTLKIVK